MEIRLITQQRLFALFIRFAVYFMIFIIPSYAIFFKRCRERLGKKRENFCPGNKIIDFYGEIPYNDRMLKTTDRKSVKVYKFKFSAVMIALFCAGLALCAAGIGLNIWRIITQGADDAYAWLQYILLFFVSIFLAVLIIAMLVKSQYAITDKHLVMQFGIIKTKYELDKICSVHLFKGANRLTVYFDDYQTKYVSIVVKEIWYDDFIKTLTEKNDKIGFSFSTKEEEDEIKKKK